MNHLRDKVPHVADGLCQYAHQFNNKVLICKVTHTYRHTNIIIIIIIIIINEIYIALNMVL
jgi:zinc finger FYVE domain-containing protein 1